MSHFDEIKDGNVKNPLLGDEWKNWDGSVEKNVETGKFFFLIFSGLSMIVISAFLFLLYYMILPRLNSWHGSISKIIWWTYIIFVILGITSFAQLIFTSILEKKFFFSKGQGQLLFKLVFNWVFKLGQIFGISRDKMGNSFVKVSNGIARALKEKNRTEKLLILLPRCLNKEILNKIKELKNIYPVDLYVVAGGEAARQKVKELKPTAIVGVACERDLVSGIRDVGTKLSVIGITNQRPEGPCINTQIDLTELINAIEFYVGSAPLKKSC